MGTGVYNNKCQRKNVQLLLAQYAGGGSVEAHYIYPTKRPLFRAGIADSSTGPLYVISFHHLSHYSLLKVRVHHLQVLMTSLANHSHVY